MFGKSNKAPLPTFDETSFDISYKHGKTQLQQIRIDYKWVDAGWKHRLPQLNCQWFNKTQSSMEPITDVEGESYQPSVMDVGTIIYLQITPESKQMEYIGMPIVKFIGPLSLNQETEEQVSELIEVGKSTYFVEVSELKLKGLPKMESSLGAPPLKECLLKVIKGNLVLMGKWSTSDKAETIMDIKIAKCYPKLLINRRNCKQVAVWFNQNQYAKVVLQNHKVRDVFYLVVKRAQQNIQEDPVQEQEAVQSSQSVVCDVVKSDESLKKSEQTLPQSPQTKAVEKQQKALELKIEAIQEPKIVETNESESFKFVKEKVQVQIQILRQSLAASQKKVSQLEKQSQKAKQEACYHKNQSRILNEKLTQLEHINSQYKNKVTALSLKAQLTISLEKARTIYGQYVDFIFEQLLEQIIKKDEEIRQINRKYKYQLENRELYQFQIKQITQRLESSQGMIRNLEKKVDSLTKDKSVLTEQVSTQHTYSSQLGSYEFQIGKLKEQIKIVQQDRNRENESLMKQIQSLKIQVKELIEENTYLRSKEKSSKSELKNQMVQLKKLVNRFGQSMSQKDIHIDNLRLANRELNKELLILREKVK